MKRALLALLLVASPAFAQANGWAEMANGWGEMQTVPGFTTIPPPSSATLGCVGVFLGSPLNLQCAPASGIVYTVATKSLDVTDGRVQAGNLNAIPLPASGSVTVAPVLSKVGSITTVAGSALVDGDYFTIEYAAGNTVPVEFDLSPGDGTTGGRVPYVFAPGDTADQIRDGLITLLNSAAGTSLTASSGGAATVSLVLDTPGAAGGTNSENVANAGFAVTGFVNPTAATTYTYSLQACLADGSCNAAGPASTTAAGVVTLSAYNLNRLSWSAVPGAASYKIRRDVGGATQGVIWSGTALTVDDTGLAGDGSAKPTVDGTGTLTGRGVLATGSTVTPGTGTATARVGGVLYADFTERTTATTSPNEVLFTYPLPANTLSENGKGFRVRVFARHAANTNPAILRVYLGSVGGAQVNANTSTISGAGYYLVGDVYRTAASAQMIASSSQVATISSATSGTAALDTTAAINVIVTGSTGTAAGDLTMTGIVVEAIN